MEKERGIMGEDDGQEKVQFALQNFRSKLDLKFDSNKDNF